MTVCSVLAFVGRESRAKLRSFLFYLEPTLTSLLATQA